MRKCWLIAEGRLLWTGEIISGATPRWAVLKDGSKPPHTEGPIAKGSIERDKAIPKEAFTDAEADEVTSDLTVRGMTRIIRIPMQLWKRIPVCWDLFGCSRTDGGITYLYCLGGWWFKQDPVHLEKMRNQASRFKKIAKDSKR
jgi:hypothetical protein